QRVQLVDRLAAAVLDPVGDGEEGPHALDVKTLMLTGDNPHTAAAIAAQVGIDAARGNLLPEDKLREVEARQADGSRVGMVGDGINDAPALA
ncbi:HAD-IC family P-type ATPase, partial [Pseudomonas aeruginosa]